MTGLVPTAKDGLRTNNFDALRLLLALLVVWSHSFALWYGSEDTEWVSILMGGTYNSGNIAVLGFFAISGFLITLSWTRSKSWTAYLKRRVLRIYPGYLVAITLCSLVIVPAYSSRAFGDLSASELTGMGSNVLLRNYIISSDAFGGGAVNGSLWSIPYEFWCYLGVMALGLAGLMRYSIVYPIIACGVMAARIFLDMTGRHPGGGVIELIIGYPYFWFNVLPPFLLGGAAYLYRDALPRSRTILFVLIFATIGASHLPLADPLRSVITRTLLPPTLVYAVLYVALHPRLPTFKAARFGDFSYGAYLYAFPIQQMLVASFKGLIPFPVFVALGGALSLGAGIASWHLVERWFLSTRKQAPKTDQDLPAAVRVAP